MDTVNLFEGTLILVLFMMIRIGFPIALIMFAGILYDRYYERRLALLQGS